MLEKSTGTHSAYLQAAPDRLMRTRTLSPSRYSFPPRMRSERERYALKVFAVKVGEKRVLQQAAE